MKNRTKLIVGSIFLIALLVLVVFWKDWTTQGNRKYAYIPSALVDALSTIATERLENAGLDPVPFITGRETVQALIGGATFAATLAEWPFLLASSNRSDLRVIAVITSAESMGILVNSAAGINSVRSLVGKRVGFPQGTSAQFLYESFLSSAGILEEVNTVNLAPPQLQGALLRDDIQAIVIWQPFLERARMQRPDDFSYLPGSQSVFRVIYCVVSTEENIKKDPEGIRLLLEALLSAENDLNNNSAAALNSLAEKTGLERETLDSLLPLFRFKVVLDNEIIETLEKLSIWAHSSGLASEEILERDWIEYIHTEALRELAPDRVQIGPK